MPARNRKVEVAFLSVISNTSLVFLKIIVGIITGSVSVISEAIHSGVDLLAAIIALFAVKTSSKSPDQGHPFGHGKVENISGTVEAFLIFIAAGWIIYESIHKFIKPKPLAAAGLGVAVMIFSAVMNLLVSHKLFKVGKETDSMALQADAWHLRTDVYTSAGVMAGLAIILIGRWVLPDINFNWLDPVAAIAVAMLIIRTAYKLTVQSARDLLDASLPAEEEWICNEIQGLKLPIRGYHHLRTRKAGATRFVELHIVTDKDMSIQESHRVSDQIVAKIKNQFPESRVIVHAEPCDGSCRSGCLSGCLVKEQDRLKIQQNISETSERG